MEVVVLIVGLTEEAVVVVVMRPNLSMEWLPLHLAMQHRLPHHHVHSVAEGE